MKDFRKRVLKEVPNEDFKEVLKEILEDGRARDARATRGASRARDAPCTPRRVCRARRAFHTWFLQKCPIGRNACSAPGTHLPSTHLDQGEGRISIGTSSVATPLEFRGATGIFLLRSAEHSGFPV